MAVYWDNFNIKYGKQLYSQSFSRINILFNNSYNMGFYRETAFYSFHLQWERQLVKERRYTALIIIIKKNMMHLHIPSLSIFQHCYSIYCSLTVVVIIFFSFHINNSFYLIILHFPCSFIYYLHFLPSVFDREKK